MNGALQIFNRRLELDRQDGFSDQLPCHGPDDMDTEYFIVFFVGNDLDETGRLLKRLGTPVGRKGEGTDLILLTGFFDFRLGQAGTLLEPVGVGALRRQRRSGFEAFL